MPRASFVIGGLLVAILALALRPAAALPRSPALIAYTVGLLKSDVWVVHPDGSGRRRLTRTAENEGCPAWSPDGRELAVEAATKGPHFKGWIEVLTAAGRRLWRVPARYACPAWSPDGKRIAFYRTKVRASGDLTSLDVVAADGHNLRTLATDVDDGLRTPAWSPDGKTIAFVDQGDQLDHRFRFSLVDVISGHTRLLNVRRARSVCSSGSCRLDAAGLTWAPSRDIAFLIGADSGLSPAKLYAVHPDGTGQRLVSGRLRQIDDPAWSPDGARLAFTSRRGVNPVDEIWTVNGDGSELTQVTRIHTPAAPSIPSGVWGPVWSPDGRRLACRSWADDIYVLEPASGRPRLLVRNAADGPSWRPGS